ncbi:MAG: L-threonylcarbamoyladenylate synthase [Actinomycetota bacterium]
MSDVDEAASAALEGRLVVIPTDTVYGIGTRPDASEATGAIFEAKGRPRGVELPVLVANEEAAAAVGEIGPMGAALVRRFWPGPLTLVVARTTESERWDLGGDPTTVGLRIPAHPLALELLRLTGPLAVTSANHSGEPTPDTCEGVRAVFGDAVAVYVCSDQPLAGAPSTVVDLTGDRPRILRAGSIPERDVLSVTGHARRFSRPR